MSSIQDTIISTPGTMRHYTYTIQDTISSTHVIRHSIHITKISIQGATSSKHGIVCSIQDTELITMHYEFYTGH